MNDDIETLEQQEWPAPPPEREPPPRLRTETLHRAVGTQRPGARGRVWVPLAAAACVSLIVGGFVVADQLRQPGDSGREGGSPNPTDGLTDVPEDDFDLGPLTGADLDAAIAECTHGGGGNGSEPVLHYARTVDAPDEGATGAASPAVVFTIPGGRSFACVSPGLLNASQAGLTAPSGPRDVVDALDYEVAMGTSGADRFVGRRHWLYGVGSDVAYLRIRLVVDGEPTPWQVGRPHDDGYVYVGLRHVAQDEPMGEEFVGAVVETEAYDVGGERIDDPDLVSSEPLIPPGI
jgi:hypothetical protein